MDHYVGMGGSGIVIEYCVTGFGYVYSMSVGLAVFNGGVDGLSESCEGSGEIADGWGCNLF